MIVSRKIVVALVGLMALTASVAAPAALFGTDWIKTRVLDELGDWLGRRVEIQGEIVIAEKSWHGYCLKTVENNVVKGGLP